MPGAPIPWPVAARWRAPGRLLLAVTVLAALAAVADERWILVEGGSWVPDAALVGQLRERIGPAVTAQARAAGRELRPWATYTFQYQGQEEGGRRFVFVNAFCVHDEARDLRRQMVLVSDGGTCFFSVRYDPASGGFSGLLIHGEA